MQHSADKPARNCDLPQRLMVESSSRGVTVSSRIRNSRVEFETRLWLRSRSATHRRSALARGFGRRRTAFSNEVRCNLSALAMSGLLLFLQYAVNLAFVILGLLTLRDWLVHRERSRGYLALAIGLLAITALIGQVQTFGNPFGEAGTDVVALVFLASAYAMLLFRSSF